MIDDTRPMWRFGCLACLRPATAVIVDSHVHLLPERLAAKIRKFFEERGAPRLPYPVRAAGRPGDARRRGGIARCWSLPYAHRAGVACALNRWMAETFAGDPFVVPGATVHPGDDVEAVVREAIDALGLRVFKIHCSVGAFRRRTTAGSIPSGGGFPRPAAPSSCTPAARREGTATAEEVDAVGRVAGRWPGRKIIVAHFGAPAVERTLDLLRADAEPLRRPVPGRRRPVPRCRVLDRGTRAAHPLRLGHADGRCFDRRLLRAGASLATRPRGRSGRARRKRRPSPASATDRESTSVSERSVSAIRAAAPERSGLPGGAARYVPAPDPPSCPGAAPRPAIREKDLGIWQTWTWEEAAREIRALACGLAARGFRRGDCLAIIGDNRPRLYWAMAAAQCLGGVPVPLYQDAVAER